LEFGVGDGKKKEEAGVAFYQLPGWWGKDLRRGWT
jgi:hypothetical protein